MYDELPKADPATGTPLYDLMKRNGITSGVTSAQMRKVIQRVATGELREIDDIARALRGF